MLLVAGCYERFVFGYQWDADKSALVKVFTNPSHRGPVRSMAAAGALLAVGGSEDMVHVYDLRSNKDLGMVMVPGEGSVSSLALFTPEGRLAPTHLFTGSGDGSISFFGLRAGDWECMRTINRAHSKEVAAVSVHPSGKLALTAGREGVLKMWELARGRCTYTTKLAGPPEGMTFSPSGLAYAIAVGDALTVHGVVEADKRAVFRHARRVLCHAFHGDDAVVTGCEDGSLSVWSVESGERLVHVPQAHDSRVRALSLLPETRVPGAAGVLGAESTAKGPLPTRVFSASSDGSIKVWDFTKSVSEPITELATRARLTCLVSMLDTQQLAALAPLQLPLKTPTAARPRPSKEDGEEGKGDRPAKAPKDKPFGEAPAGVVDFMGEDDEKAQRAKQASVRAKLAKRKRGGKAGSLPGPRGGAVRKGQALR